MGGTTIPEAYDPPMCHWHPIGVPSTSFTHRDMFVGQRDDLIGGEEAGTFTAIVCRKRVSRLSSVPGVSGPSCGQSGVFPEPGHE